MIHICLMRKKLENNYMERRKEINNKYKFKEPELKILKLIIKESKII